jgi:hypothetical protein
MASGRRLLRQGAILSRWSTSGWRLWLGWTVAWGIAGWTYGLAVRSHAWQVLPVIGLAAGAVAGGLYVAIGRVWPGLGSARWTRAASGALAGILSVGALRGVGVSMDLLPALALFAAAGAVTALLVARPPSRQVRQIWTRMWPSGAYQPIAILHTRLDALAAEHGLQPEAWDEDGLGSARGAGCRLASGRIILLRELAGLRGTPFPGAEVRVDAGEHERLGTPRLMGEVLAALGLSPADVAWQLE